MSQQTAVKSYQVVGTVTDMNDFITNIDPDQTLLTSRFGKLSVHNTEHSWLCDSLRPAMDNATLEVHDFSTRQATPRRRESNFTQQFEHGYTVSDITQAIKKYGVRDEKAYQMLKASKEIGRDLEYAIVSNKVKAPFDETTAGRFGGIPYFLDNFSEVTVDAQGVVTLANHRFVTGDKVIVRGKGTNALDAKYKANTQYFVKPIDKDTFTLHATAEDSAATPGTPIKPSAAVTAGKMELTYCNAVDAKALNPAGEFTMESLNDAIQAVWGRGGDVDIAVMSGKNKRKASTFTANSQRNVAMEAKKLTQVIDVLETDFGVIELVAHRLYADDVVDLLELQYWKLGYLIPFHNEDLERKGTYKESVITGTATLECTAPIANARLYGISK